MQQSTDRGSSVEVMGALGDHGKEGRGGGGVRHFGCYFATAGRLPTLPMSKWPAGTGVKEVPREQ